MAKARIRWLRVFGAFGLFVILAMGGLIAMVTQPVLSATRQGPVVDAQAAHLQADVLAIAKPRDVSDTAALDATAMYISDQLRAAGYQPEDQPYPVQDKTYRNVRVLIGDPKAPRLVVGAHYDSCQAFPAADDNASGVAVVLELARLLKANPAPGALELVFWSLEEPPMFRKPQMGSVIHAKSLTADKVNVTAALSIETVGYYTDEPDSQYFPVPGMAQLYSTQGNYVALVADFKNAGLTRTLKRAMRATEGIGVHSMSAPASVPGVDWSDHRSYWAEGMPGLMVTDSAPNRNPNYHKVSDTPNTLDYKRMALLTNALFEGIWVLTTAK